MTLRELLDEREISKFLDGFKQIFGGILFVTDNLGSQIGQGCAEGGLIICTQCPRSETQIISPIEVEGVVLGSLVFCEPSKGQPGKIEISKEDLNLIAGVIAGLAKSERDILSLSEEVNINYEILNLLYEIGEITATTFEKDVVCRRVLEQVGSVVRAGSGCILLREGKDIEFNVAAYYGVEERLIKGLGLRFGQGMVGKVLSEGKATLITKIDPTINLTKIESLFCPPLLVVPIKGEAGTIIGLIILARKNGGKEFTAGDLKLVQAIAIQAGAAVRNIALFKDLKDFFLTTVQVLASTIDARDPYTVGHSQRVAEYSLAIGQEMGLSKSELEQLQLAALLHDIGTLVIPERIIHCSGELSEEDRKIIKEHPFYGVQIIQQIKQFEEILPGIWHHHEYYDGGGYPAGLAGEDIPISGRIIAVADAFDAMTSDRAYRKALSVKAALVEIEEKGGIQFDPQVVSAFKKVYSNGKIEKEILESEKKRLTF